MAVKKKKLNDYFCFPTNVRQYKEKKMRNSISIFYIASIIHIYFLYFLMCAFYIFYLT